MNRPDCTIVTFPTNGAITQYYAVELGVSGVTVCDAVTDTPVGWANEAASSGGIVDVQIGPIVLAVAGEAINAGVRVGITTAGKLTATIAQHSTIAGVILDTASGDGSIVRLLVGRGAVDTQ